MLQLKQSITITLFALSCFCLNTIQANSSFPNVLPKKMEKGRKKGKSSKDNVRFYLEKIKKRLKKGKFNKNEQLKFSKKEKGNRYGKIALWSFFLSILFLLLVFINPASLLTIYLTMLLHVISAYTSKRGWIDGKDKNPKLAKKIFRAYSLFYSIFIILIICLVIVAAFIIL